MRFKAPTTNTVNAYSLDQEILSFSWIDLCLRLGSSPDTLVPEELQSGKDDRADTTHEQHWPGRQMAGAAPLWLGCSSRKCEWALSYIFWIKPMLFITSSFLHYSAIHEIALKLEMFFNLLVKAGAGQLLLTNKNKAYWSTGLP